MEKKLINKFDLSFPFIIVVMTVALFLSGCNLNAGTGGSTTSSHDSVAMAPAMVETSDVAEPVAVEVASSTASYRAGAIQTFDQQKFDAALSDGKTVFLDFYATWCPTCRANEPIVDGAFDGSHEVVGFRVDYDNETALKKKYSVISQSTYLVLRDGEEVGRYLGALTSGKMNELLGS